MTSLYVWKENWLFWSFGKPMRQQLQTSASSPGRFSLALSGKSSLGTRLYKLKNGEDTPGKLSRGVPRHRDLQTLFKTKIVHVAYDPDLSLLAHSNFITNIMELDFQFKINLLVSHMKTTHRQSLTLSKPFCSERHPVQDAKWWNCIPYSRLKTLNHTLFSWTNPSRQDASPPAPWPLWLQRFSFF